MLQIKQYPAKTVLNTNLGFGVEEAVL